MSAPLLRTAEQAAELIGAGITAEHLRRMAYDRRIPFHRRPGTSRGIYFTDADIAEILDTGYCPAVAAPLVDDVTPQATALSTRRSQGRKRTALLAPENAAS